MDTKRCCICKRKKPHNAFAKAKKRKDGLQGACKSCRAKYDKQRYENFSGKEKDRLKAKRKAVFKRNCAFILDYLKHHPCVDCDEADPIVLEFHHLRDKTCEISNLRMTYSIARIKKEIAKCIVLCANCHRRRTYRKIKSYRKA